MFSTAKSCMPGISRALVLLRTIRWRRAFRSPTAGGRVFSGFDFFLILADRVSRNLGPVSILLDFFFSGAAYNGTVVCNVAMLGTEGIGSRARGGGRNFAKQLQQ